MGTQVAQLPRARVRARGVYAAVALLMMLPSLMPLSRVVSHWLSAEVAVIVQGFRGDQAQVQQAVSGVGGHVVRSISIIDGAVAAVPADSVGALQRSAGVREVTPDGPVHMQGLNAPTGNAAGDAGSLYNTTLATGAQAYWAAGYTGKGIDVAVIDTGAVPVNGLQASGKLVFGPDLSFDSQSPNLQHLDAYGHGTHMSGIIAGRDNGAVAGQYVNQPSEFLGMAPDARIVSVKVGDSLGNTDVSQVLAAIDWVVQHHADPGLNIRVVNMSFGTDSYQSYLYDPLTFAAETAWHAGVVVVAATGNSGIKTGVMDPADDPYVIAVGAADTNGSTNPANFTVAGFSAGGDGARNPDLVAPGAHIEGLRDPGSYIDDTYPTARYASRLFLGSGTSQATAVVSGAAALVLSQNPTLTPDMVKNLLTSTAQPLANTSTVAQGAGVINLRSALTALPATAVQAFAPAAGTGTLEGARGSLHLTWGAGTSNPVTLQGEYDIFGSPVNTTQLAQNLVNGGDWVGGSFNGVVWTGTGFGMATTQDGYVTQAWNTATWTASSWSQNQWSQNQWSQNQWSQNQWSQNQWSQNQWSQNQWSQNQWSSNDWAAASWG
jgi:serine protease AprX